MLSLNLQGEKQTATLWLVKLIILFCQYCVMSPVYLNTVVVVVVDDDDDDDDDDDVIVDRTDMTQWPYHTSHISWVKQPIKKGSRKNVFESI